MSQSAHAFRWAAAGCRTSLCVGNRWRFESAFHRLQLPPSFPFSKRADPLRDIASKCSVCGAAQTCWIALPRTIPMRPPGNKRILPAACMLEQPELPGTALPVRQFLRRMHALSPREAKLASRAGNTAGERCPQGSGERLREAPVAPWVSSDKHPTLPVPRATILGPFLTRDRFLDSSPDIA